jgi:hypothetical protein
VPTVSPGGTFDLDIVVANTTPARGLQFDVLWDPTKVQCVSAEQGDYFQNFANANNGSIFLLPSAPQADNTVGKFPKDGATSPTLLNILITGAGGPDGTSLGVTGSGTAFVLHMAALSGASGTVQFTLENVLLGDNSNPSVDMHAKVNNGTITISS